MTRRQYAPDHLRRIIATACKLVCMHSLAAEDLLLGTAATESHLGRWDKQINGPALGLYQMEPSTLSDIYNNYLYTRPTLLQAINTATATTGPDLDHLRFDPVYSTIMARIHYKRVKANLPDANDLIGQAKYWKTYYNTVLGKGTPEKYVQDYIKLIN
jgi:type VI secretion system secreted protein VgrG